MVVFQELKEEKIFNVDRNLYLNARKISYVTLVDIVAQKSAQKNNLDTFNETFDGDAMDRKHTVQYQHKSEMMALHKKRMQSVNVDKLGRREDSVNLLDDDDAS